MSDADLQLEHVHVGDVFDVQLGKMLSQVAKAGTNPRPYLGNRNVQWGRIETADLEWMDFSEAERAKFELKPGDLLVCEGGEVGRTAIWRGQVPECYYQKALHRLRPKDGRVLPEYMFHYMRHAAQRGVFDQWTTATSIAHLTKEKLEQVPLPLPPLPEQRRIADILDKADAIRRKRQEAIRLSEKFLRSTFLEMFGDPVTNPKGWPEGRLDSISDIASGVTKGRKFGSARTVFVPYMRVANVQDGHISLEDVKDVEVLPDDVQRFRLLKGDVLLTEGGDPDKLGRGAVWTGAIEQCIHQNHIFRVRPRLDVLLPEFLSAIIGSARGKSYFLRASKQTTGIASINMTQLRAFPALVPPLSHQHRFQALVEGKRHLSERLAAGKAKTSDLFDALVQRAFRGEL